MFASMFVTHSEEASWIEQLNINQWDILCGHLYEFRKSIPQKPLIIENTVNALTIFLGYLKLLTQIILHFCFRLDHLKWLNYKNDWQHLVRVKV